MSLAGDANAALKVFLCLSHVCLHGPPPIHQLIRYMLDKLSCPPPPQLVKDIGKAGRDKGWLQIFDRR